MRAIRSHGIGLIAVILIAVGGFGGPESQAQTTESWTDRVRLSGDVRYRYQVSDEEGLTEQPREQHRIRARLALKADVGEGVFAHVRLVTNRGNPISDFVTMTDGFDDKEFRIDRAYVEWNVRDALRLLAGKMAQPWVTVSDLVFARDMNPEGVALRATLPLAGNVQAMATVGYWQLMERSEDRDTTMVSAQLALKLPVPVGRSIVAGASGYDFDELRGRRLLYNPKRGFGNTTLQLTDGDESYLVYASDYRVLESFVQWTGDLFGYPLVLGGQLAWNTEVDEKDRAWLVDVQWGSTDQPNQWMAGYQFRRLEGDSVLAVFAENTDTGDGTDVKAHIAYVRYAVTRYLELGLQYAMATRGLTGGRDLDTLKADISVRF